MLKAAQVGQYTLTAFQFLVEFFIVRVQRCDLFPDSVSLAVLAAGIEGFPGVHLFREPAAAPLLQPFAMAGQGRVARVSVQEGAGGEQRLQLAVALVTTHPLFRFGLQGQVALGAGALLFVVQHLLGLCQYRGRFGLGG